MAHRPDPPLSERLLEHQGFLRRCARELVGEDDAEDLVQEAFVAALEAPDRKPRSLRAWLGGLLRNRSADRLDARRRREARERRAARPERVDDPVDAQHVLEARLKLVRDVADAIAALPDAYREALYLRTYEDLVPGAIAKRLGVPRETVHSRLRRAKQLVRERLDRETDGGRRAWSVGLVAFAGRGAPPTLAPTPDATLAPQLALLSMKTLATVTAVGAVLAAAWILGPWNDRDVRGEPSGAREVADVAPALEKEREPERTDVAEASSTATADERRPEHPDDVPLTTGILELRFTYEDDDAPAAGVFGHLRDPWGGEHDLRLDEDGRRRFPELAPGEWVVQLHGYGAWRTNVVAGGKTSFAHALDSGIDVRGRVLDHRDRQVAGAEIFLSNKQDLPGRWTVAVTDDLGWFTVRELAPWSPSGPYTELAARADGFASSRSWEAKGLAGADVEVVLRLRCEAAALRGRVVDHAGEPVSGAEIECWDDQEGPNHEVSREGLTLDVPPRLNLTTDVDGRFETARLAPGRVRLLVHCEEHPMLQHGLELEAGANPDVELRLALGGGVEGTVCDEAGEPIANADVSVQVPHRHRGRRRYVRTDGEGRYRLAGLEAGEQTVTISSGAHDVYRAAVTVSAGETTEHDVELATSSSRAGLLVDGTGAPLAGHHVCVIEPDAPGLWVTHARTGTDGRFLLTRVPDGSKAVEVRRPDPFETAALVTLPWPKGDDELLLEVPLERLPSASLRARIVDGDGAPLGNAELWLNRADNWGKQAFSDLVTGELAFDALVPGTYSLSISAAGHADAHLVDLEVLANRTLDLDDVVLTEGGSLSVELRCSDPTLERVSPMAELRSLETGEASLLEVSDGRVSSPIVASGRYELRFSGFHTAFASREVVVETGRTTELEVTLDRGVMRPFELVGEPAPERVEVEVFDAEGAPFRGYVFTHEKQVSVYGLSIGTWRIRVRADDGRVAQGTFEVVDHDWARELAPLSWD